MAGQLRGRSLKGPLNATQTQIMKQLVKGWTHARIARELGFSRVAVSENVCVVVAKMGASNSWDATARFARAQAYMDAAELLSVCVISQPRDATEEHVNHVLTGLAATLRGRAAKLLPQ